MRGKKETNMGTGFKNLRQVDLIWIKSIKNIQIEENVLNNGY